MTKPYKPAVYRVPYVAPKHPKPVVVQDIATRWDAAKPVPVLDAAPPQSTLWQRLKTRWMRYLSG